MTELFCEKRKAKILNHFCKKALSWMFERVLNTPLFFLVFQDTFLKLQRAFWSISLKIFKTSASKYTFFYRISLSEVLCKKVAFKTFSKFAGKHLCKKLFFNKVAGLSSSTLLKRKLWRRCFPVNFVKFLITPYFIDNL